MDPRREPWPGRGRTTPLARARCNICGWSGRGFGGRPHCESAICPSCGSIARDRYLYHCFVRRVPWRSGLAVLETSPRLGKEYRDVMRSRLDYRASDFDHVSHVADLTIDLQDVNLPDASLDVVLTPHVLEHVPDTSRAVRELHRVVRPGGLVLLQVPLLQPRTTVPAEPEFHEDRTLVHWRFGVDLTSLLREGGFVVAMLVTDDLAHRVATRKAHWRDVAAEFDAPGLVAAMDPGDLVVVASRGEARRSGFEPSYMFVTWECRKPAGAPGGG